MRYGYSDVQETRRSGNLNVGRLSSSYESIKKRAELTPCSFASNGCIVTGLLNLNPFLS